MAIFWFLVCVVVWFWGYQGSSRAKRLAAENAQLNAARAAAEGYGQSVHASYQALQRSYDSLLNENHRLNEHSAQVQRYAQQVASENQTLSRYRPIADVDAEVARRRTALDDEERSARQRLATANLEARALQNIVDGYGDRYLVATRTLLDELADAYAHTDPGQKLKEARQKSRELVKTGRAAVCGYAEDERRQAAIEFVIDAFNGKVDTVLAKAKADNFGTLQQALIDGFAVVNMNGRASKDTRITTTYLQARTEELRWAVVIHELREQEREEQRVLREQMREEEKARREYERAQKEAAKEEDVIRRAMARAQQEIATATDAQRQKYEAQLQELALRLQEAEDKNRRAISLAQQTKRGHVYIISNVGSFGEEVFKIGLTRRFDPLDRVKELGDASVPFEFDVHALIVSDDAPALEHALHRQLPRLPNEQGEPAQRVLPRHAHEDPRRGGEARHPSQLDHDGGRDTVPRVARHRTRDQGRPQGVRGVGEPAAGARFRPAR